MIGIFRMLVIIKDNLVKKFVKAFVRIVWSSVKSDSWILVFDTRKYTGFERDSLVTRLILVLFPDIPCHALFELRLTFSREERIIINQLISWFEILWALFSSFFRFAIIIFHSFWDCLVRSHHLAKQLPSISISQTILATDIDYIDVIDFEISIDSFSAL